MKRLWLFLIMSLLSAQAHAHLGSKDVFETVHAGPYTLYVTVRPPNVIPGVATVEVHSSGAAISSLQITPLPVTGEASKHPPSSDIMQQSSIDPNVYSGAIWIMASGTWQVRIQVDGAGGAQVATVPVVAVPISALKMQTGMGLGLGLLGLFLVVTMAGIVAASFGEARLKPGVAPDATLRRKSLAATAVSVIAMVAFVLLGGAWWNAEATDYSSRITTFAPAETNATLSGNQLDLMVKKVSSASMRYTRSNKDYLPDHGHLMHLYAIREPGMDAVFHLHPMLVGSGDFRMSLPAMPPGHYKLYGDVVHASGFPETLLAAVDISDGMQAGALDSEDASATPSAISNGDLGPSYRLPDGYTMTWDKPASLSASTGYSFHFQLLDPQGKPAQDMQPYLGMAGHAAFVKTDGTVFAHTHPEGSAAMADVMLAIDSVGSPSMTAMSTPVTSEVDFAYGFPTPGRYRIFIQMKHGGTVETGVFDAEVK